MWSFCDRGRGHRLAAFRLRGGTDVVTAGAGECEGGDVLGACGRGTGVGGLWWGCGSAFQHWVRGGGGIWSWEFEMMWWLGLRWKIGARGWGWLPA